MPLHYAMASSLGADLGPMARAGNTLLWIADQLNRFAPAALFAAALHWGGTTTSSTPGQPAADGTPADVGRFLFCWGVLPLVLMAAMGLVAGSDLQRQWGTAFMPLSFAWLLARLPAARWRAVPGRTVLAAFLLLQALLLLVNWLTSPFGPGATLLMHNRNLPSQEIASALQRDTRRLLAGPVCVVAGKAALASVVALRLPEHPLVLLDGRREFSPWLDKAGQGRHCETVWVAASPAELPPGLPGARPLPAGHVWTSPGLPRLP
jgi:hypothetical protein